MWENRCKVAVSGVGFSQVTRTAETPLAAHALQAVKAAVEDSGLELFRTSTGWQPIRSCRRRGHAQGGRHQHRVRQLHDGDAEASEPRRHIQTGTVNIGGAVQQAVNAPLAGVCKYAVVWRAMHNPRGTYQNLPGTYAHGADQFHALYGLWRTRARHGGRVYPLARKAQSESREDGGTRGDAAPTWSQESSLLLQGLPLTREEYLNSRMVAYPFCLYDCDIPVQGAVAIVLTTADRARDLKPRPAYLAGYGQRLAFEVAGRIGSLSSYMEGGSSSARLTWERSGFTPKDVDVAQIYDGFSASVIYGLESYGFCQGGRSPGFHSGRTHRAGR